MTRSLRVFRREGEYWTLGYAGTVVRVRDAKGLHYIPCLLDHPGEGLPVLALSSGTAQVRSPENPSVEVSGVECASAAQAADVERTRLAVTQCIKASLKKIAALHPSLGYHLTTSIKTGACCTYMPDPEYTDYARQAGINGMVVLLAVVGADGLVKDIRVQRSLEPSLDQSAMDTVRTWRFQPALKDGQPVAVQLNIETTFRLAGGTRR